MFQLCRLWQRWICGHSMTSKRLSFANRGFNINLLLFGNFKNWGSDIGGEKVWVDVSLILTHSLSSNRTIITVIELYSYHTWIFNNSVPSCLTQLWREAAAAFHAKIPNSKLAEPIMLPVLSIWATLQDKNCSNQKATECMLRLFCRVGLS